MIELAGVGVPRPAGAGWLPHRVCTRFESRELTIAVSRNPAERRALLDAVVGRLLPTEGRISVGGVPIGGDRRARPHTRLGDADLAQPLAEGRSVLWNALAARRPGLRAMLGFARFPRPRERQATLAALERVGLRGETGVLAGRLSAEGRARLLIARELARWPLHLVVREVDAQLHSDAAGEV